MDLQEVEEAVYEYISSGEPHSTIIGMFISVDHSSKSSNEREIREFSKWFSGMLFKVKDFQDRKMDVKTE